jgi:hypothetical protein
MAKDDKRKLPVSVKTAVITTVTLPVVLYVGIKIAPLLLPGTETVISNVSHEQTIDKLRGERGPSLSSATDSPPTVPTTELATAYQQTQQHMQAIQTGIHQAETAGISPFCRFLRYCAVQDVVDDVDKLMKSVDRCTAGCLADQLGASPAMAKDAHACEQQCFRLSSDLAERKQKLKYQIKSFRKNSEVLERLGKLHDIKKCLAEPSLCNCLEKKDQLACK